MVPSLFRELPALPVAPNGKLDRKKLIRQSIELLHHDPQREEPQLDPLFMLPRTATEQLLAEIWSKVLGISRVSINDNFFELGGDSFLSVQIIQRANEAGLQISYRQFFQHQTIAELAQVVQLGPSALPPIDVEDSQKQTTGQTQFTSPSISNRLKPVVHVTIQSLRAFGREALKRAGLSPEGAAIVTEVQLEASLRGQATHNMESIPRYVRRIAAGVINARPRIRIERETPISAVVEGDNGPGQWISFVAMELAIKKARKNGLGVVGATRSNHFGAAGHYAWLAAHQNLIGLCTSNARVWLAPTGGLTPTFGNNPLAVGIPSGQHHPILLDISMSVAAKGKIGLHVAQGKSLPFGWIFNQFGNHSTDLADLAAGLGVPIGGHKGYGLTLIMEVLAGALTGAGFCWDHDRKQMRHSTEPADIGHFFLAINPELFMPIVEFTTRIDRMIDQTKAGKKMENIEEILIPGELEMRARERNLRDSVPLDLSTFRSLKKHRIEMRLITELVVVSVDEQDQAVSLSESTSHSRE